MIADRGRFGAFAYYCWTVGALVLIFTIVKRGKLWQRRKDPRPASGRRQAKKTPTAGGRRAAAPKKRPIRREVGGVVCLVLALCIAFSYFQQGGWLLDRPAALCRGLVGYGYYTVAPVLLLLVSYILLFHRGRNVTACVVGAALIGAARRDAPPRAVPDGVQQHDRCSKAPLEERACNAIAVYLLVLSKYCLKFW